MTHPLINLMQSQPDRRTIIIPQKRKSRDDQQRASLTSYFSDDDERDELDEDEEVNNPSTCASPTSKQARPSGSAEEQSVDDNPEEGLQKPENEYEAGRVICEVCGEGVSIRHEQTGVFSVAKWNEHRSSCSAATTKIPIIQDSSVMTPETTAVTVALALQQSGPPSNRKKRRPKRSEEQRIDFFRTDPHVAQFEAYRVLCGSCNKWIRLRSNSSYCSIPWEAHRKSCLAKKSTQGNVGPEQRRKVFANDPDVREYEDNRVLCNVCESWIIVKVDDHRQAIIQWNQHKSACSRSGSRCPEPVKVESPRSGLDRVPPSSKGQLAYVSPPNVPCVPESSSSATSLTPSTNLNDVRRRNAEQRAATLLKDPLIGQVEPLRVFCVLCQKWIHLRKDLPYCSYPWSQHKSKCVRRHEKMAENEVESATGSPVPSSERTSPVPKQEDNKSGHEYPKAKRVKLEHVDDDTSMDEEGSDDSASVDDGDSVDLESTTGRTAFICQSVEYLFRTTYSRKDEMTIALLVTYLNSTLPPDKYEEFDTIEVAHAAAANPLFKNGRFVFEGDVLRIAD